MIKQMKQNLGSWKLHRQKILADPKDLAETDQRVARLVEVMKVTGVDLDSEDQTFGLVIGAAYTLRTVQNWAEAHKDSDDSIEELIDCLADWVIGATQDVQEAVLRRHDFDGLEPRCICGEHEG